MNRSTSASLMCVAVSALLFSAVAQARLYRYTDESGQIVISNTVPAKASVRGYEVIDDKGRVVQTIDAAPTQQELDARAAREERKKEQARQREEDTKLLKRFSTPDDAVRAMYRKLQELKSLNQLKRGNIAVLSNQLADERSRAANLERSGREIPDSVLEKIDRLQAQISDIEKEIAT
ncbi:MAG: DUF4124 domain-containing protein, partial [Marinobacter sp.]|nr:DUF4124 domain-containing protein [Marinobacter sp.]